MNYLRFRKLYQADNDGTFWPGYIELPENVEPTISDRDFVIATIVPPTVEAEPEKGSSEEAAAEGEEASEGKEETSIRFN